MKRFCIALTFMGVWLLSADWVVGQNTVPDKYKVVQGLGYLHTQVKLLLDNWSIHPLNTTPLDDFEEEWQKHLREEIEHDEEWAEFMLVEENLLDSFGEGLNPEVEGAVEENLKFYRDVIKMLRTPEQMGDEIDPLKESLAEAEDRLYQVIFPAMIK
ncbi:MAG: hypothetical protein AAGN35_09680 [Bacteroidota bacterium]